MEGGSERGGGKEKEGEREGWMERERECEEERRQPSFLFQMMLSQGVEEVMFTSDGQFYLNSSLPLRPSADVLLTVNFMNDKNAFKNLKRLQVREREREERRGIPYGEFFNLAIW